MSTRVRDGTEAAAWDDRDAPARWAVSRPSAPAGLDLRSGERVTYAELHGLIGRCAGLLRARIEHPRGARVAFLGRNSLDAVILMVACERTGAIFAPLNWRLAPSELAALTADCQPALAVWQAEFESAARTAFNGAASLCISPQENQFRAAVDAAQAPPADFPPPGDPSIILYTSGTTGRPKGVVLSRLAVRWGARNFAAVADVTEASVMLCEAPMFHTVGLIATACCALHQGGLLAISDRFAPEKALERLADPALGVTHMFGVPQIVQMLCEHPDYSPSKLAGLRALFSGGAPLPQELCERLARDGVLLINGYGMTETSTIAGMPLDREIVRRKVGAAGRPAPAVELKLVRRDGSEAPTGQVGEVWVRGPAVTSGYWGQPQATATAFEGDWFRTGDAARLDEDGFLHLVDRWKDMYISGGENVYPAEVEAVIAGLEGVREVGVVGVPDARWGEVGWAFVAAEPLGRFTTAEVLAHCSRRLARYKLPAEIRFVEALPRTGSGKVRKDELRRLTGR